MLTVNELMEKLTEAKEKGRLTGHEHVCTPRGVWENMNVIRYSTMENESYEYVVVVDEREFI